MADARSRILERLRRNSNAPTHHANPLSDREPEWQAKQRPLGDLGEVFVSELEKVGSKVIRVPDWKSLPEAVGP